MPIIVLIVLLIPVYYIINWFWSENIKTKSELREKAEKWDHFQRLNTQRHMRKHFKEWAKPGMMKEEIEEKTGELYVEKKVFAGIRGTCESCVVWETQSSGRIYAYFRNGLLVDISNFEHLIGIE